MNQNRKNMSTQGRFNSTCFPSQMCREYPCTGHCLVGHENSPQKGLATWENVNKLKLPFVSKSLAI